MKHQVIVCLLLQLTFELASCMHIQTSQGSKVELPCYSSESDIAGANITWTFNGQNIGAIPQSPGSAQLIKNDFYASISPVTAASEGKYVCLAVWDQGEVTTTYSLKVESFHTTVKVLEGSNVFLPCYLPSSSGVISNARWFKETGAGQRTRLNTEDVTSGEKIELLSPNEQDQTIMMREVATGDAGVYVCESVTGEKLNSLHLEVEALPTSSPRSCNDLVEELQPCQEENSRTAEPILRESITEFSMKLYSYLKQEQPSSNLLFSPISIGSILSHLLLGASGNTRTALEGAICVPHDFHCVHLQMKKQKEKMGESLQMASQIYYNSQMNLSESFSRRSVEYYDAEPTKLLESSEENTRMINLWVANKTNNKITNLISEVSPNAQLIMINAVSFSGQWKFKFNDKPKKGLFTKFSGDMVRVPVIHSPKYQATMMYVPELKAQVARFALTGDNSLYILLPHANKLSDLQQVEERMTDGNVRRMIEQLNAASPQTLEVNLPQIKLDVEPNMNVLFKKLGLSSLFEGASLCGISSDGDLVLDEAKHKALLTLSERGVDANAATSLSFSRSFPTFIALRPFIMLLWSDQADVPLFIGRVTEP
ncbi:LOW QUALITY PROTEIN: plasma protease C1 inhibitor [Fundulus heteroclitus]|uniref:LOW QUALITY PROTEIN: plasma protease C1 inhibitor n=1 Tax=Fundulus heteroclitus TaxID=8078 RepID=UPI00165A3847|nr:LOW QUALITY PROTEIN: plasma protease C1 inhibitor [Fundulus heteroclitus]